MKKRWLAVLAVLCLMVTMVAPAVYADETTDGEESTTVTRIEGEALLADMSSGTYELKYNAAFTPDDGETSNAVGINANKTVLGFGSVDLTNLQEVRVGSASPNLCLYTFCTGTAPDSITTRFAAIQAIRNTGDDWTTVQVSSADLAVDVTGEQNLFVIITSTVAVCSNLDYIELVYGDGSKEEPEAAPVTLRVEAETWDKTQSAVTTNAKTNNNANASAGKFLDYTSPGDIVYLGNISPRSLASITVCVGNQNTNGVPYGIYVGGTAKNLGTKIATVTGAKTATWADYTPFTAAVDEVAVAGIKVSSLPLFLKVESTNGNGGNIDYIDLTYDSTVSTTRVEMESYNKNNSTATPNVIAADQKALDNTNGQVALSSGLYWVDGLKQGQVYCLGDHDLTGLRALQLAIANNNIGLTYEFYIDGTMNALGTKIAEANASKTSGWYAFTPVLALIDNDIAEARIAGTHTLFLKVVQSTPGSGDTTNGGNADYVDLIFGEPQDVTNTVRIEAESYDESRSEKAGGCNKNETDIGWVNSGCMLYLGEYDLTDLHHFVVSGSMSNTTTHTVQLWIDGTATDPGTMIAETPDIKSTGGWDIYKEHNGNITVSPETVVGTHAVYLSAVASVGSTCSNLDYIDLVYKTDEIPYTTAYNFGADANKEKSTSGGLSIGATKVNNTTADTITLAYDNIDFKCLSGINITHAPAGNSTLQLYKDNVDETALLGAYTLDGTKINTNTSSWYDNSNLRTQPFAIADSDLLTGTGTLYMVITKDVAREHIGDLFDFSLYYEPETQEPIKVYTAEAEKYVWSIGTTAYATTTNGVGHINNAKNGNIFYLGKADISDLTAITIRTATAADGISYTLYADMDVDFAGMTINYSNANRYTGTVTGGTVIADMAIAQTAGGNNWQVYSTFSGKNTSGLTGEHELYLKLNQVSDSFAGNIDYIRFVGVDELDTSSNWPAEEVAVSFVGQYKEVLAEKQVASVEEMETFLTSVTAPTVHGYTFVKWDTELNAEELFNNYKYGSLVIRAVYEVDESTTYTPILGADFTAVDGTGKEVNDTSVLTFDARVTVTAALDKEVAYWVLDGAKVGFGQTSYTFYVSGSNDIDVVYADEVSEDDSLTSSVVLQQSVVPYNGSTYTFSVVAQTSIVGDDALTEYGMIYAATKEALEAVRNGETANTITVPSSKKAANAQYITHLLQVKADKTRYAMAYAIINGNTVYSTQYATVTTPTDGSVPTTTMANFQ